MKNLKNIIIARNGLTSLPDTFFADNSALHTIDLSGNALEQSHFKMSHLQQLTLLNISNNVISRLDDTSRDILTSAIHLRNAEVDLRGNPLAFMKCEDMESVQWFVKMKQHLTSKHDITCLSENNNRLRFDEQMINIVKDICDRPKRIIIWTTVGCLTFCLSITLILVFWRHVLAKRKKYRRRQLIYKITNEQPGYEFVAFLSYSSADHDTVERYVIPPLEKTLQLMVGVERSLLCLGDYQYRAGYPLHDETVRCLNMSCVVIFVVSDSFCRSDYCQYEFIQAKEMGKPVILMIKEACDKGLMHPLLKEVFERNTRVVWLSEGDNFILKNTWEHVCVYSDLSLFVRLIYSVLVINLGISDQFKKY